MTFQTVKISSEAAMDSPIKVVFDLNGVQAYSSLIPQTYTHAKVVWFVSDNQGGEYGQFKSQLRSEEHAVKIASLAPANRIAHER